MGNIEDYLYNESDSRNFKEKLSIHSNASLKSTLSFESIDQELNDLFVATPNNNVDNTIPLTEHNLSTHNNENVEMVSNRSSSASISTSECSSRSSITNGESESDGSLDESEECSDSESENSLSSISTSEALHAEIDVFPVNMIALEKYAFCAFLLRRCDLLLSLQYSHFQK